MRRWSDQLLNLLSSLQQCAQARQGEALAEMLAVLGTPDLRRSERSESTMGPAGCGSVFISTSPRREYIKEMVLFIEKQAKYLGLSFRNS